MVNEIGLRMLAALLKNAVKLFGAVHHGTECFCRVGHESLDLLHSSRDTGQKFHSVSCDCNVILNANLKHIMISIRTKWMVARWTSQWSACRQTHPSKASEPSQHLAVHEAALGGFSQRLVQKVFDEVNARLHSEDHPLLHHTTHPKALQPWLTNALHTLVEESA